MNTHIFTPTDADRSRKVCIAHTTQRPDGVFADQNVYREDAHYRRHQNARALSQIEEAIPRTGPLAGFRDFVLGMCAGEGRSTEFEKAAGMLGDRMAIPNAVAKKFRENPRHYQTVSPNGKPLKLPSGQELYKGGELSKAVLDVGTQTNFTAITGGQSLGYVSLDTRMARGTVRPDSFSLYQALNKSAAYQVVDYWSYVDDPGGPIPGAAYASYSSVQSGSATTNAGVYDLQSIDLRLALNGRAVTMALMAQNNFVDVVENENANAALSVLESINWASYYGNPTLYPSQQTGLFQSTPTSNMFDFGAFYVANAGLNGWSQPQTLYNMIYEVAAQVTSWGKFGRTTHAFMTPVTAGSLQGLVTTVLNNITNNLTPEQRSMPGIVVDGDLQGMRTRMGLIQFVLDLFISARDTTAQSLTKADGTTYATTTNPTPATGVVAAISGAAAPGSNWGAMNDQFVASGSFGTARYAYAVASTDAQSNESTLTWSNVVSGITATGAYVLTIAPPGDTTAVNFRVYRTGNGGFAGTANSPTAVRYIGTVAASGSSNVTYADLNTYYPGGEKLFLLDLREEDFAVDYRFLLPLTRVELFAQNAFMPWLVAAIGAVRNRIPKFNAVIYNFLPDSPVWNAFAPNQ